MPQLLVVTPNPTDRRLMATLLAATDAWNVVVASNMQQALTLTHVVPLDALLVDVCSPGLDGLAVMKALSAAQPLVPVIAVGESGSDGQSRAALHTSAADYVSRSRLTDDLVSVVERVLAIAGRRSDRMAPQSLQTRQTTVFELENDPENVGQVVQHVTGQCCRFGVTSEQEQVRVAVALEEALLNAIIHGNLQISSELRERSDDAFRRLVQNRRQDPQYAGRRVRLNCDVDSERAKIQIRDEGPGFDVRGLADPRDPKYLMRASGRGVLLMRTFMDEVVYNSTGNEVTLVKRRRNGHCSAHAEQQSCTS